jgi:hypothetical protein
MTADLGTLHRQDVEASVKHLRQLQSARVNTAFIPQATDVILHISTVCPLLDTYYERMELSFESTLNRVHATRTQ